VPGFRPHAFHRLVLQRPLAVNERGTRVRSQSAGPFEAGFFQARGVDDFVHQTGLTGGLGRCSSASRSTRRACWLVRASRAISNAPIGNARPIAASLRPIFALPCAAMRTSQARARIVPPAMAWPLIIATVGFDSVHKANTPSLRPRLTLQGAAPPAAMTAFRSSPPQKNFPAPPVRTTARTASSRSASPQARSNSWSKPALIACRRSVEDQNRTPPVSSRVSITMHRALSLAGSYRTSEPMKRR